MAAPSAYRASHTSCNVVVLFLAFRRDIEDKLAPTPLLLSILQRSISRKELGPEHSPASHHLQCERVLISFHRLGQ